MFWRPVKGYESKYEVSALGEVRTKDGPVAKWDRHGYERCTLRMNGKKKNFSVHRLVAEAFIPNPDKKEAVNHIDKRRKNNKASNLEWVDNDENQKHKMYTHVVHVTYVE